MPNGHSDTAIDFYASSFCEEMLDTAHPTRFSKERLTYGNDIFDGFRGQIWAANTLDEIAEGGRLVGGSRIRLARLNDGSRTYGRLIDNMLRAFGQYGWKDHFLTTYPDDRPVAFTTLDFDRHPPKGRMEPLSVESDEWLSIDEMFWHRVSTFHELATRLDLDVMWAQSPGRWLIDGHDMPCRMFGLHAVVRHEPHTPSELRPMLAAMKGRIGLDVETSWDIRNRNIRIPGQCFLDVCRVDPARRSILPVRDPEALAAGISTAWPRCGNPSRGERERNMARLVATVDGYGKLRPEGGERLLGARLLSVRRKGGPPEAAGGLVTSPSGFGESPAPGSTDVGQGLVASPSRRTAAARKPGSTSARKPRATSDNGDPRRWLREPDTFRTFHGSGLLRNALREFGWEAGGVEQAVEWTAPRLRSLRPASSATCSDDGTLAAFIRRHFLWGCRTYDPAKATGNARRRARIADEAWIAPSLRLDDKALDAYLKGVVGLSEAELCSFRRFRALERRHAGRVACRTLYAAFGGQRGFMAFRARHGLLQIAQEHSQSVGRCRQWTLATHVIRSVRMMMTSPVLQFMVCGKGERVIYSETRSTDPPRRRRIFAVRPARGVRRALGSVAFTLPARGPPPKAPKTREIGMVGKPGSAAAARRRRERAAAA